MLKAPFVAIAFGYCSSVFKNFDIRDIFEQPAILCVIHITWLSGKTWKNWKAVSCGFCVFIVWNICLLFCPVMFHTFRLVMKENIVMHEIHQDHRAIQVCNKKTGREKSWNNDWKQFFNKHQTMDLLFFQKKHVYWLYLPFTKWNYWFWLL